MKNDAATMDRILADDFTLVTGSGKVFNKADSLAEARSGQYVYEHQEDTSQTVRVWGDTAVVMAKIMGERHTHRKTIRQDAVVQRHLRPHSNWLALRFRLGITPTTRTPLGYFEKISSFRFQTYTRLRPGFVLVRHSGSR